MSNEQQRHDISDKIWDLLKPHLPRYRGQWAALQMIIDNLSMEFSGFSAALREMRYRISVVPLMAE